MIKRTNPRPIKFSKNINPYAQGSVLVEFGQTKVYITATVQKEVPSWLKGQGQGWVTAEYSMLPGSTHDRTSRGPSGRTQEIQRLIGRSLRSITDLESLGERLIILDCDVLVADGGTRTACISGAYVALKLAIDQLSLKKDPLRGKLAALSVGINDQGDVIADLDYAEDSSCKTDMNIVMTDDGRFVEIQGTAEEEPFTPQELTALLECAKVAMAEVFKAQEKVLGE